MIRGMAERPYDERVSKLLELFPDGPRGVLRDFAAWVQIAEDEIAAWTREHPELAKQYHATFVYLWGTPPLRGKSPEIYRAHVRELLDRVTAQDHVDLDRPTSAELLCVVLAAALKAPLAQNPAALAEWLFEDVRKRNPAVGDPGLASEGATREAWGGAVREQLRELRRKYRFARVVT